MVVLPPVPSVEVDTGFVPDVEHFAMFWSSLTQKCALQSFEDMHVVLFLTLANRQMSHGVVAQIVGDKGTRGGLGTLFISGIMGCRSVPVAVSGIDVEGVEVRKLGERVMESGVAESAQLGVEFLHEAEATRTLEGFEIERQRRIGMETEGVLLEESSSGFALLQNAMDTEGNPIGIGKLGTTAEVGARGEEMEDGIEKDIRNGGCNDIKIHLSQILRLDGLSM